MPQHASGRRGKPLTPTPPVTPPSPSLQSNAVPLVCDRLTYSVGPAARPHASINFRSSDELEALEGDERNIADTVLQLIGELEHGQDAIYDSALTTEERRLLANRVRDYSWGFFVFVIDYSPQTKSDLPELLAKLVAFTKLALYKVYTDKDSYAEEGFARFRLEVVEDEATLANASIDRVRAEFLAMILAKRPDWPYNEMDRPPGPIKNKECLLLDFETSAALRDLQVPDRYDPYDLESCRPYQRKILKLVDGVWRRQERSRSIYRGWIELGVLNLPDLYVVADRNGSNEAFEDEADRY